MMAEMAINKKLFPKTIRLNATYCFIMIVPNIIELQQIAFYHSSDTDSEKKH